VARQTVKKSVVISMLTNPELEEEKGGERWDQKIEEMSKASLCRQMVWW
jgi:hypothetical protein